MKSLKASTKPPQSSSFLVSRFSLYRFYFTSTEQRLTNFHLFKNEKFVRRRRRGEGCRGGNFGVDFEFRSIKRMNQEIIGNQAFPLRNFVSIKFFSQSSCFFHYSFITSNFEFISLEFKFLAASHSAPIIHVCIRFLEQPAMAVTWRVFLFFLSWKFLPKTLLTSRYK